MTKRNPPPVAEPTGYESVAGYVKSCPENNLHYLEQYKDWPYHGMLEALHRDLEELIPGYNIAQIKLKFNELRYYIDFPKHIPVKPQWSAYDSEEKIKAIVKNKIAYAEGYVAGYEAHSTDEKKTGISTLKALSETNSVRATLELMALGSFVEQTEEQRLQAEALVRLIHEAEGTIWEGPR